MALVKLLPSTMAFVLPNSRKRLRSKQVAPAAYVAPPPMLAALADEALSEMTSLSDDARRKHVPWVHVRTKRTRSVLKSTTMDALEE